jgi:hypothetical protein
VSARVLSLDFRRCMCVYGGLINLEVDAAEGVGRRLACQRRDRNKWTEQ